MEIIEKALQKGEKNMGKAYSYTQEALAKIHAGRASPNMLDAILVDYHGSALPIQQMATISTPDVRVLTIQPWEKATLSAIEKAILNSQLGFVPQNDGALIMINIPPITQERRKLLVKQVRHDGEHGRVTVRNVCRDVKEELKKIQKEGAAKVAIKGAEKKLQEITDRYIGKINALLLQKETEIMQL